MIELPKHARFFSRFILAVTCFAGANAAEPAYFAVTYPPSTEEGKLQIGVTHTVWIPEGVKTLRGIIVHQHGCGVGACKGGETAAYDLHWQALARKWDCALLGPSYHQAETQNCRLWCDPRNGSNAVFLEALDDLAEKSGHPELATVPWCLWGHSGGGFWASLFQMEHPERIVAIWFQSGTAYSRWESGEIEKPEIPEAAMRIPMVANPGGKEKDHERFKVAWNGSLAMFKDYRSKGAPIAFAPDPLTGHETGDSRYLAIPFFDACLAMRLPEKAGEAGLKPVDESGAWLGSFTEKENEARPASDWEGDPLKSIWLPNERIALAWSQFVTNGTVGDSTPPEPPNDVAVSKNEKGGVDITWDAAADFESGLQGFVIFRDGKEIGRIPEKPKGRFGRPLFQAMSYHDTPEAPLPEMRLHDAGGKMGNAAAYSVIAINSVGLKSTPANAR